MWGNDYPHAEGTFRGSRELIAKQFAGVPDDERAAMLGGTLAGILGYATYGERARFDGRVAVVTGAGRGHRARPRAAARRAGRQRRGQRSRRIDGRRRRRRRTGRSPSPPQIVAAGGAAIADGNDVSTVDGAEALIGAALERFGRIDILINNAGIIRWAGLPEADADNLAQHLAVHVGGSFNTARAAWPHLVEQGYGRIVMTTSSGVFGLPTNLSYAAAKGGGHRADPQPRGRGRQEGHQGQRARPGGDDAHGRAGRARELTPDPHMAPELVAPMAAFLAHESCPVTGEIYAAGAGRFARIFLASTPGYVQRRARPSRTSPRTGRRSTTKPATPSRRI